MLEEAEKRGIKVIADLVLNHISKDHEWFTKSVQRKEPYSKFFIWKKNIPQGLWGRPWATSESPPDWGYNDPKKVWFYNDIRQEYYYSAFDSSQPDLNLTNPQVVSELYKLTKFWADKGFDGYRLDAIRYAIEEGAYPLQADTNSTIQFWVDYSKYVKEKINFDFMLVSEIWESNDTISKYYQNGNSIDTSFDFSFGKKIMCILNPNNTKQCEKSTSSSLLNAMIENFRIKAESDVPMSFYSTFLSNHDQDRMMYQLGDDPAKMEIAAVLLLTNVGTPYIYYGEEIGLTQNKKGDDVFKRAPMQWNTSKLAGFTSGNNVWVDDSKWIPWRKNHQPWWKIMWENYTNKLAHSVTGQKIDQNSLFNLYRILIKIRKENAEFRSISKDSIQFIKDNPFICAYKRTINSNQTSYVLINSSFSKQQTLLLNELKGKKVRNLITNEPIDVNSGTITLKPAQYIIFKLAY